LRSLSLLAPTVEDSDKEEELHLNYFTAKPPTPTPPFPSVEDSDVNNNNLDPTLQAIVDRIRALK
jgi:hypothetical protein